MKQRISHSATAMMNMLTLALILLLIHGAPADGQDISIDQGKIDLMVPPTGNCSKTGGGPVVQTSNQQMDLASLSVNCTDPTLQNDKEAKKTVQYSYNISVGYSQTAAANYGSSPVPSKASVQAQPQSGSSPNAELAGTFPGGTEGYYKVTVSAHVQFTDSSNNQHSGDSASQDVRLIPASLDIEWNGGGFVPDSNGHNYYTGDSIKSKTIVTTSGYLIDIAGVVAPVDLNYVDTPANWSIPEAGTDNCCAYFKTDPANYWAPGARNYPDPKSGSIVDFNTGNGNDLVCLPFFWKGTTAGNKKCELTATVQGTQLSADTTFDYEPPSVQKRATGGGTSGVHASTNNPNGTCAIQCGDAVSGVPEDAGLYLWFNYSPAVNNAPPVGGAAVAQTTNQINEEFFHPASGQWDVCNVSDLEVDGAYPQTVASYNDPQHNAI